MEMHEYPKPIPPEASMERAEQTRHVISTIGWGLLLIWWGISLAIDPITIGMSAVGTGLIFLGAAAACAWSRVPVRGSTVWIGFILATWGGLDTVLHLNFWASLAVLFIILGLAQIGALFPRLRTA
jgi:hypothetical protein